MSIRELHRARNEFEWCYQPRNNLVKDENGELLADTNDILNRWQKYFSQLWNVHNISVVRQREMNTAESLVSGPWRLDVEIDFGNIKPYKSPKLV
jgi:hypothetical protein